MEHVSNKDKKNEMLKWYFSTFYSLVIIIFSVIQLCNSFDFPIIIIILLTVLILVIETILTFKKICQSNLWLILGKFLVPSCTLNIFNDYINNKYFYFLIIELVLALFIIVIFIVINRCKLGSKE